MSTYFYYLVADEKHTLERRCLAIAGAIKQCGTDFTREGEGPRTLKELSPSERGYGTNFLKLLLKLSFLVKTLLTLNLLTPICI